MGVRFAPVAHVTVALVVIAALLVEFGSGRRTPPARAGSQAPPARVLASDGEVPSLRTRTSRTYVTESGLFRAKVFHQSVNYRDASGEWAPIDDTLRADAAAPYRYENAANRYKLKLPDRLAAAPVRIEQGSHWVSFALQGADAPVSVSGNSATYAGVLPGVELKLASLGDEVKESLALAGPTAPTSFTFD